VSEWIKSARDAGGLLTESVASTTFRDDAPAIHDITSVIPRVKMDVLCFCFAFLPALVYMFGQDYLKLLSLPCTACLRDNYKASNLLTNMRAYKVQTSVLSHT